MSEHTKRKALRAARAQKAHKPVHILVFLLCFVVSGVIVYQTIGPPATPPFPGASWSWLKSFRALGFMDQLAYAAIASNAKWLNVDFVEPFTSTGNIIYARNWYVAVGLLAWVLDIPVTLSWQVCGIVGFLLGLGFMAWACYRTTSRYWASLIPGPLALTGVYLGLGTDAWQQSLLGGGHGVLWSPYVVFYVLNAEVGACFLLMISAFFFFQSLFAKTTRNNILLLCVSAFLVGVVGSVATYFFLVATLVSLATVAFFELHTIRSRMHQLLALLIPTLLFVVWVLLHTGTGGGIRYYAISVLPIAYLLLSFSIRNFYPVVLVGAAFLVGLLPQLLPTLAAMLSNDAFLAYRQTSSLGNALPVPFVDGVVAATPFLIIMVMVLISTFATDTVDKSLKRSLALGCVYGFFMLSWNNVWGFHQEPYRFWIDTLTLSVLILSPLYAEALVNALKVFRQCTLNRLGTVSLLTLFCVFYVNALPGFGAFRDSMKFFDVDTPHLRRQLSLIHSTGYDASAGTLLLLNPRCDWTSPSRLKVAADVNVALYRPGMAWPGNKAVIDKVLYQIIAGDELQVDDLIKADISGVLTHSKCALPKLDARGGVGQAESGGPAVHERIEIVREPAESRARQDSYYVLYRVKGRR